MPPHRLLRWQSSFLQRSRLRTLDPLPARPGGAGPQEGHLGIFRPNGLVLPMAGHTLHPRQDTRLFRSRRTLSLVGREKSWHQAVSAPSRGAKPQSR